MLERTPSPPALLRLAFFAGALAALPVLPASAAPERPSSTALALRSVELFEVTASPSFRPGRDLAPPAAAKALEIRLAVDPFLEGDAEPVLWVGGEALHGHRIVREKSRYLLAFDAFEPEKLEAGACLRLGFGRTPPAADAPCAFRFAPETARRGEPLREARLAANGPPPAEAGFLPIPLPICAAIITPIGPADYYGFELTFYDAQDRRIDKLQAGDTLAIAVSKIPALRQVQLRIVDDTGQEWAYARLSSDAKGEVPRTVVWYNTGVIGTTSRRIETTPDPAFKVFERAYEFWRAHRAFVEVYDDHDQRVGEVELPIDSPRSRPLLYPSTKDGVLMNAMKVRKDAFYVTGTGFPAGSTVEIFVVENRYAWQKGDPFQDLSGKGATSEVDVVQLAPLQTSFTIEAWPFDRLRSGRYDLIARVEGPSTHPDLPLLNSTVQTLETEDVVSFGADTGVALFEIVGGHIVMEIAGRSLDTLPWYDSSWFEFSDVFERGQTVFGAVDPTDFPSSHPGGEYAAYFVVKAQPASYWDAPNPVLTDISGPGMSSQPEIAQVKYSCINLTRTAIWPNAQPPGCLSDYQVIVDFGAAPATSSGAYVFDNEYDLGNDFIDRYPGTGFTVVNSPSTCCTFGIGRQDYYNETLGGGDPNEAWDMTSLGFPLVRNWFTLRYPAQYSGVGAPLPTGSARYPVVLILHGRHPTCAQGYYFDPACAPADRIASHRGYDYMLDALAQRGYIAISIDAYDIQPSNDSTNYYARGMLVLEHLQRMAAWDLSGSDPWGGLFQNRIDMSKIAIAGHSRGGEGVLAAAELDQALGIGLGIDAVIAIAPTDQDWPQWQISHSPYLLILGSADGDVSDLQGFRPWDDAFPTGSSPQYEKSVAYIHGANHNFWNTVWTPGSGDPYASDDGAWYTGNHLTAAQQRQTGLQPLVGFVLQQLGGIAPYREILTGHLPIAAMPNQYMHWSYQHPTQKVLDDFENGNTTLNTLGGAVSLAGGPTVSEGGIPFCALHSWNENTGGVAWSASGGIYASTLPVGQRNVSGFTHLTFRVAQVSDGGGLNPVGQSKNLIVRLVDAGGNARKVMTVDFRDIPYPYERSPGWDVCQMKSVRIPLRNFTMNISGVDLSNLLRVEIELPGTGQIAVDDLQFTK